LVAGVAVASTVGAADGTFGYAAVATGDLRAEAAVVAGQELGEVVRAA
jgi:hypothetical protein